MSYNTKTLKSDLNGMPVPQYFDSNTDDYIPLSKEPASEQAISNIGSSYLATIIAQLSYDKRGLAVNKPSANSVPIGTTYWSVDTDPHAQEVEVSNGTNWTVM